jgi:hypothetical protein
MRPLTRVAAAGLLVGAFAGALALRPPSATTQPLTATQAAAQTVAVATARAQSASIALAAARQQTAARHQAYLRSRAALAASEAARRAAAPVVTPKAAPVRHTTAVVTRTVSTESYLARGTRIYNSFHYDVTKLGYRMVFKPSVHGLLGLTDGGARTVTVYIRSTESDVVLAHSIAHEIGHALDFSRGSDAKHQLYLSIRHLSTSQYWYGCNNCTDYATPAGDWAEVFAQWLAGPGDFRSQMGGVPSSAQLSQLGDLFRL